MSASSWWDKSTGFALLTILLWASLAALTSRITSVSPLVLVGLVLFFCGAAHCRSGASGGRGPSPGW